MPLILDDTEGPIKSRSIFHEDGKVEVIKKQDVSGIIDANKQKQNDAAFNNGYTPERDMKHVASIPMLEWQKLWEKECKHRGHQIPIFGREMNEAVKKIINDPDYRHFRTGLGHVGGRA